MEKDCIQTYRFKFVIRVLVFFGLFSCSVSSNFHSSINEFALYHCYNGESALPEAELLLFPEGNYLYKVYDDSGHYIPGIGLYKIEDDSIIFQSDSCKDLLKVKTTNSEEVSDDSIEINLVSESPIFDRVKQIQENDTLTLGVLSFRFNSGEWVVLPTNKGPWKVLIKEGTDKIMFRYKYKHSFSHLKKQNLTFYSKEFKVKDFKGEKFEVEWVAYQYSCLEQFGLQGFIKRNGNILIENSGDTNLTGLYIKK